MAVSLEYTHVALQADCFIKNNTNLHIQDFARETKGHYFVFILSGNNLNSKLLRLK